MWIWTNIWQSGHYRALKLSKVGIIGGKLGPQLNKVGTIGRICTNIEQSVRYRSPNQAKCALSEVELVPNLAKWALSGPQSGQVGTIGGGCGPRVDLDTLSYGQNGRFLDTIDKIKGSSGQLAISGRTARSAVTIRSTLSKHLYIICVYI